MEGPYVDYFSARIGKPVLLAGPVVPELPQGELEERETFLPATAATELLLGLEATNRPFLVVLKFPNGADAESELAARVPPGFEERVKGRGVLHTGWVQQQHILQHPSVWCYVDHSGFSSVVEGLVAGCRLVLLPMKTDQYINAAVFACELHVGVEVVRRGEDGWFGRDAVSDAVTAAVAAGVGGRGVGGADGEGTKWSEFFLDDAVQKGFATEFQVTTYK
ncbi:hypothetical protein C2845_PM17G09260 [Panicum miliaceum]|uniref:Uncharacterized protein n=1 Tax=Panicum miliaceum TaxID=4540 RepID=A0A3L6Q3N8_PANMI|nr:hypothetical protein C2845_PM17G09260 [Panicum miliaceum]